MAAFIVCANPSDAAFSSALRFTVLFTAWR